MEQVARTLDLVPAEGWCVLNFTSSTKTHKIVCVLGAALPVHVLSYIQSLLLIKSPSPIPQAELNDEKVDFGDLKTNDILQRAR